MIKIPQVFFWKFYSRGKLTCTKTFCFVISTKECICNTQFHGLVTPTVHSYTPSLKNPKLREQLSLEKSTPTHESPFNFKNWSGKSDEFEKLVGEKRLFLILALKRKTHGLSLQQTYSQKSSLPTVYISALI